MYDWKATTSSESSRGRADVGAMLIAARAKATVRRVKENNMDLSAVPTFI